MTRPTTEPYYREVLARVHDLGFGGHADGCAPGVLAVLEPVGRSGGTVLELGCGSGLLTRHLVAAGHRVVATDASPAMVGLTAGNVGGVADVAALTLPDDRLPPADAVVSVGHVLNYLADEDAVRRTLAGIAQALRPGGVLVLDLCDLRWAEVRLSEPTSARVEEDWAIFTRYSVPHPRRFVRDITAFVRDPDGRWVRDDERHVNVLVDVASVPGLLARHGVEARVEPRLGDYALPEGLFAVTGRRSG